jgi:hypothetical protein
VEPSENHHHEHSLIHSDMCSSFTTATPQHTFSALAILFPEHTAVISTACHQFHYSKAQIYGLTQTARLLYPVCRYSSYHVMSEHQAVYTTGLFYTTGLLTTHNTLRTHLYLTWLSDSPLCRCGAEGETSAHILRRCEALASLRHVYLG